MITTSIINQPQFPDEWIGRLIKTGEASSCHRCHTHICRVINNELERCVRCGHLSHVLGSVIYTLVDRVVVTLDATNI